VPEKFSRTGVTRTSMRIGLYHGPLYHGANGYETYGPYARYVAEFARRFEEVVVFAPVTRRETDYRGCRIEATNVRVVELPDFSTHIQATRYALHLYRIFKHEIGGVDVINCRNTAPYGYLLYFLGRARDIGFFYHFTSDPWEILTVGPKYRGLYGLFARSAYSADFMIQKCVMRRSFSFVNGRLPYERLRSITDRLDLVISSTLMESDLHAPDNLALHEPVRLLYVGYLKHMKGLDYLIEAVNLVRREGIDAELHLVGSGPEEDALRRQAANLALDDRVHFHGYVPMGRKLNRHYDEADVFVFPSLSEGSPRVVLEGLAHGLPMISTEVGSVPDLVVDGHSGLVVPLRDAGALAGAMVRYVNDDGLRRRCAVNGFSVARGHTLEHFIAPLVEKAKSLARRQ